MSKYDLFIQKADNYVKNNINEIVIFLILLYYQTIKKIKIHLNKSITVWQISSFYQKE